MSEAHALGRLEPDARARLDAFARALDRIHVDELPLHVARARQPRHRQAVETAEIVAIESALVDVVDAARRGIIEQVLRLYNSFPAELWMGMPSGRSLGTVDDRVLVARSVGEAATALVLGDRLDADDRDELLGLWTRLLP